MLFVNLFENDFKLFLPEFFLVTAILTIVLYGSFYSVSREHNYPLINVSTCWASVFTLVNTFFLIVFTRDVSGIIFNGTFISDLLSQNSKLFIIAATIVCLLISLPYIRNYKVNSFEYFLLILLSVFGLMLLCSSFDLISVYLAIELQSLCLYVLAAFNRESAYSTEAGLKYFILGAFASGLLLFGISIIYGFTGTTNFEDLHMLFALDTENQRAIQTGLIFISCAFLSMSLISTSDASLISTKVSISDSNCSLMSIIYFPLNAFETFFGCSVPAAFILYFNTNSDESSILDSPP